MLSGVIIGLFMANGFWLVSILSVIAGVSPMFLRINETSFNGVRWFNKEKMDDTLWYAFAAITMYSPRNQREQIHRLIKTLSAAKERAEYKCANFLEALIPEKKTAKKKPAVKSKAKE